MARSLQRYPPGIRDLVQEQVFNYGMRAGLWRVLDAFAEPQNSLDLRDVRPHGGARAGPCPHRD